MESEDEPDLIDQVDGSFNLVISVRTLNLFVSGIYKRLLSATHKDQYVLMYFVDFIERIEATD